MQRIAHAIALVCHMFFTCIDNNNEKLLNVLLESTVGSATSSPSPTMPLPCTMLNVLIMQAKVRCVSTPSPHLLFVGFACDSQVHRLVSDQCGSFVCNVMVWCTLCDCHVTHPGSRLMDKFKNHLMKIAEVPKQQQQPDPQPLVPALLESYGRLLVWLGTRNLQS